MKSCSYDIAGYIEKKYYELLGYVFYSQTSVIDFSVIMKSCLCITISFGECNEFCATILTVAVCDMRRVKSKCAAVYFTSIIQKTDRYERKMAIITLNEINDTMEEIPSKL